jgi:N-terminal half of MaoC dehydratase
MTLLTLEMKAIIGTERSYTAPEPLGEAAGRYFAMAIGDLNPMYAKKKIAPLTLICETNQYANLPINSDGYAGHLWKLEIPNTRLLRGGNSYRFYQYAHATDVLVVTWKIEDLTERMNSKGLSMATMISTATYRNQRNELLATNTETLIWVERGGAK